MTCFKRGSILSAAAFAISALWIAKPAAANPFYGSTVSASATTQCGAPDSIGPTAVGAAGFVDAASGPCVVVGTLGAQADAVSQASIASLWNVSGQAYATNYGSTASADFAFYDSVTLNSPLINYTGGVDVVAGDNYTLNLAAPAGGNANAFLRYTVTTINGAPAPPSYQDFILQSSSGIYTGALNVAFTILACPCSFEFLVTGHVNAAMSGAPGQAFATVHDPLFIDLPPGWTYTLDSQSAGPATPEPSTLLLAGAALILAGLAPGVRAGRFTFGARG